MKNLRTYMYVRCQRTVKYFYTNFKYRQRFKSVTMRIILFDVKIFDVDMTYRLTLCKTYIDLYSNRIR